MSERSTKAMDSRKRPQITAQELRERMAYDEATGKFTMLQRSGKMAVGYEAGTRTSTGYVQISVNGSIYLAHRLAWLHVTGEWPSQQIDHINGIRSDNRFCNLRDVSPFENQQNRKSHSKHNQAGWLGVIRCPGGTFRAQIMVKGRQVHLGSFDTPEAAHARYAEAKRAHHGFCFGISRSALPDEGAA